MKTKWRLTIADVLQRPLFQHAVVVAGSRGLMRPIRWVHILEEAENGRFLNGGELILATGLGFGQEVEKRRFFLSELIQRKAVGLCIEKGGYVQEISEEMKELAEEHDFPLIVFMQPVRFVDITLDLHERLVSGQMEALRDLEAYNRGLQKLSLQTQATSRLLQHFQRSIQQQTFYLPCDMPSEIVFVPAVSASRQHELSGLFHAHLLAKEELPHTGGAIPLSSHESILYQPILMMGHVLAYVGVIREQSSEQQPDEFVLLKMDYTANALAQILMRKRFAEEKARENEQQLVEEMLAGSSLSEDQLRSYLGLRPQQPSRYHAIILQLQSERLAEQESEQVTLPEFFGLLRSIFARYGFRLLLTGRGTRLYMLAICQQQFSLSSGRQQLEKAIAQMERLFERLLQQAGLLSLGISRVAEKFSEAKRHFQEAEQALLYRGKGGSPFFDDLGIYRLLSQLPQEHVLQPFIADYLGPLIRYDQENGSQLLETLRCYLEQTMSKQETADRLYIHRQTLYHRLEKIKDLLGSDFASPHQRLCLEVAIRAYDSLSQQQTHSFPAADSFAGKRNLS